MSENLLGRILEASQLAAFHRDDAGRLRLLSPAPQWLQFLWPDASHSGGQLDLQSIPFLENFVVDATTAWQDGGTQRVHSGPWLETDGMGREHYLQATAFTAAGRSILLVEGLGWAFAERTSLVQKAHETALAFERLQRAEQALADQKRLLESRVLERTAELSRSNAELREEIALRRRYAERLESMHAIDQAILAANSPEAIAETALRRIFPLLPCEHACVLELFPDSGRATVIASLDWGESTQVDSWTLSSEQLRQVALGGSDRLRRITNAPNLFDAPHADPANEPRIWPLIIDLPLVAEDTLVGILNLATNSPAAFTSEHEDIAQNLAAQLAVALHQARLFAQVSATRQQLGALSLRLVEAQEAERRFLARELHDEIGQILTGLKLTLKMPGEESAGPSPSKLADALTMVDDLLHRVRQLSLDLRPPVLDDLGLIPALDWLIKRVFNQTNLAVQFKYTPLPGRFPPRLETTVFRIVQEALTNIARHAQVQVATVRLWLDGDLIGVQIEDQGIGFDAERMLAGPHANGLAGMRERAFVLGGTFTVDSSPGTGTRLTVELPRAKALEAKA